MTSDTKRAIDALKPLAEQLRIEVGADDKRLYMNGQAIGISCNSTWATLMEAIGWMFLKLYVPDRERSVKILTEAGRKRIKDYWMDKAEVEKAILWEENQKLKRKIAAMKTEEQV